MGIERLQSILAENSPFPMCIINDQGKVTIASPQIEEVFPYDGIKDADIFALTGIKYKDYRAAADESAELTVSRNEKIFRISVGTVFSETEEETDYLAIYFQDISERENLKKVYQAEKTCIAFVHVDNLDELLKTN